MAIATHGTASNYLQRAPSPSGLADVVELITIDARIVIASVDTYLRFAEQVNRLDLTQTEVAGLAELRDGGGDGDGKAKGMVEGAKDAFSGDGEGEKKKERAKRD